MAVSSKIAEPSSFHKVAKPGPWPQILLSLGKADLIAKLDNKILGSESPLDVNSYRLKAFVILSHSNISETHSRFTEYANTLEDWLRTADYKILGQDSDNKPNAGIIGVAKCMEATVGETTLSTLENMWALHLEKNGELDYQPSTSTPLTLATLASEAMKDGTLDPKVTSLRVQFNSFLERHTAKEMELRAAIDYEKEACKELERSTQARKDCEQALADCYTEYKEGVNKICE